MTTDPDEFEWECDRFIAENLPPPPAYPGDPGLDDPEGPPMDEDEFLHRLVASRPYADFVKTGLAESVQEHLSMLQEALQLLCAKYPEFDKDIHRLARLIAQSDLAPPRSGLAEPPQVIIACERGYEHVVSDVLATFAGAYGVGFGELHPDSPMPEAASGGPGDCPIINILVDAPVQPGSPSHTLLTTPRENHVVEFGLTDLTPTPVRPRIVVATFVVQWCPDPQIRPRTHQGVQLIREQYAAQVVNEVRIEPVPTHVRENADPSIVVAIGGHGLVTKERLVANELREQLPKIGCTDGLSIRLPKGDALRALIYALILSTRGSNPRAFSGAVGELIARVRTHLRPMDSRIEIKVHPTSVAELNALCPVEKSNSDVVQPLVMQRAYDLDLTRQGNSIIIKARASAIRISEEGFELSRPRERLDDIEGCVAAKAEAKLRMSCIRNFQAVTALGAVLLPFLLLAGPPGTGKSMLGKAIAGELGWLALFIDVAKLVSGRWFGESYRELMRGLRIAAGLGRCVVIIDELCSLPRRGDLTGSAVDVELRGLTNGLLTWMDQYGNSSRIVVVGTTNYPEQLDPALVRDGRFGKPIYLDNPDANDRANLVRRHLPEHICPSLPQVLPVLVDRADGRSAASVVAVCNRAKLIAASLNRLAVTGDDLDAACEAVFDTAGEKLGFYPRAR